MQDELNYMQTKLHYNIRKPVYKIAGIKWRGALWFHKCIHIHNQ